MIIPNTFVRHTIDLNSLTGEAHLVCRSLKEDWAREIERAIERVNIRESSFTLSARHFLTAARDAERFLDKYEVPEALRIGTRIAVIGGGREMQRPIKIKTTRGVLRRRRAGSWEIEELETVERKSTDVAQATLELPEKVEKWVFRRLMSLWD